MIVKGFGESIDIRKDAPLPYDSDQPQGNESGLTDKEIYDLLTAEGYFDHPIVMNGKPK